MFIVKILSHRFKNMHKFAKNALFLSVGLMVSFYISALVAYLSAPYAPDYLRAMTMYRGAMEAAPATFAAGFCAAVISDIALAQKNGGSDG